MRAPSRLGQVGLRRPHCRFRSLREVGDLDHSLIDADERPVAAIGGQPPRTTDGSRGVPALRPELALALAPELADRRGRLGRDTARFPLLVALRRLALGLALRLLDLGTHAEVALDELQLDNRLSLVGSADELEDGRDPGTVDREGSGVR